MNRPPQQPSTAIQRTRFSLFHTAGCHLCEEAQDLVLAALALRGMAPDALEPVEIADDPDLLQRYGVRIPVLRRQDNGLELGWPFGLEDVLGIF